MAGAASPVLAEGPVTDMRPRRRGDGGKVSSAPQSAGALIDAAKLGGVIGYVVADARTGRVLEVVNDTVPLPPASVTKTITSLYTLDKLAVGDRFTTRIVATGPVSGGIVQGDLVLVGAGDPTLSTDGLADMAQALAARGVKGITGRYMAYADALPNLLRIDDDQPDFVGYNPGLSGLNLNFNRVYFEWKRGTKGYSVSMDARSERFVPPVSMARMQVVDRSAPLFTYAEGRAGDDWTVASGALGKAGSRWLPVRHPGLYAADVFAALARAQGITLPAPGLTAAIPAGDALATNTSDDLATVIRDMLKYSTNLTAEVLGLMTSGASDLTASGVKMSEWAKAELGIDARFTDHSGLGTGTRISAADMVRTLVFARAAGSPLPALLKEVGMRDANGKVVKGGPVRVIAKTGTLNFVSALAGYIVPQSGPELAFAIFTGDTKRRDALPMALREDPPGGHAWTLRARRLQGQLINRWAQAFI